MKYEHLKRKISIRGQTAIETAFAFSAILFLTFSLINLGVLLHTKNIATYAAFMSGRAYQVLGSQENSESFLEITKAGGAQKFLANEKNLGAIRVAEDIFTCALPWISLPEGELDTTPTAFELEKSPTARCGEGKRKYRKLNVGTGKAEEKSLDFMPFKIDGSSLGKPKLEEVKGGFTEQGRSPLRYGILKLKYQTPVLYNLGNLFGSEGLVARDYVYVPILLNPGLASGLTEKPPSAEEEEDEKK